MKPKYAEWAKLTAHRKSREVLAPIRVLNLPGFREIEDKFILYQSRSGHLPPEVESACEELSLKTFGTTRSATQFEWPDDYWDSDEYSPERDRIQRWFSEFERRFETEDLADDDRAAVLKRLGLDFTDDRGDPLRCIRVFSRQAEAPLRASGERCPIEVLLSWKPGEPRCSPRPKRTSGRRRARANRLE